MTDHDVVPPGYKRTEIGVIPEDWEVKRLGDLAFITRGASPRPIDNPIWFDKFSNVGWVRISDVTNSGMNLYNTTQCLSKNGIKHSRPVACDSLIMSICATIGRPIITRIKTCIHDGFVVFEHLLVEKTFLYYKLCQIENDWWKYGQVGSQMNLNTGLINLTKVLIPQSREEQHAIAAALSDVDGLIGALDALIAKKRDMKQAAMQQLLTGRTRLPGCVGEWEEKRLGDLALITRGASPRPIDLPVWFDETSVVGWVRISDVTNSGMNLFETTQRLSTLGIKNSRPVAKNSLIMSICATVGRPIITRIKTCIHDGFVVFEQLCVEQLYLYYVLSHMEKEWLKYGQIGSQLNLNTGLINITTVSFPCSIEEQTAIATVLSDMDAEIAALERRRDKVRDIKQGMMQQLLTGKVRLVSPEEMGEQNNMVQA